MKKLELRVLAATAGFATAVALILAPSAYADPGAPGRGPTGAAAVDCSPVTGRGVTLEQTFARSATATGVPVELLKAVSYLESRWDGHDGRPSTDGGYGPMNLTDVVVSDSGRTEAAGKTAGKTSADPAPQSAQTAAQGAELTGLSATVIKNNPNANVCAGAAVLASYREGGSATTADLDSWVDAVTRFGAAGSGESNQEFAAQVFTTLRTGAARTTADGQRVELAAQPAVKIPAATTAARATRTDCPAKLACEWVPAPYLKSDPSLPDDTGSYGNHDLADRTGSGGPTIDYIVIHDTEATYDLSLSLVQDPTYLAWNYTVRSSDGHIAQHLNAKDVGFQAGNWYLNMHSIGVEHEGKGGNGGWYTEAMYRNSATLVKYLAKKYGVPLDPAHIIGHDQVPGILPGYTQSVHWDPGPYWDWEHYFDLLGAPIGGRAATSGDVAVGDVVTVRPGFAGNAHTITDCEDQSPGSGACQSGAPTDFALLHQAPSDDAPLATDVGVHPEGSADGTTAVNDVSARAQAGNRLVVAAVQDDWVQVSWAGELAWIHNPASHRVLVRTPTATITVASTGDPVPVYGRAFPEEAAYPSTIPYQDVVPLEYTLKPGQSYAVTDTTVDTDYYRVKSYDGSAPGDRTVVTGSDVYYQVAIAHRVFYVRAADVHLDPVPVLAVRTRPTIDGTPRVGQVLTALTGQWTGAPEGAKFSWAWQWLRDGRAIKGATDQSYAVRRADAQHRLSVRVTAAIPNADSRSASSAKVRIR